MTEKLAQNLKEIELPRSIRNVLRFLADLGIALEPSASKPVGFRSGELAASVFERHLGVTEMLPSLMARHEIQALDIRRFALWIRRVLPEEEPETAVAYHGRSRPEYLPDSEVEDRSLRRSQKVLKPEPEEERAATPTPRFAQAHRTATGSTSVGETLGMIALATEVARPLWPAALGLSSFAFGVAVSRRWEPDASMLGFPYEVRDPVSTYYTAPGEPPSRPLFRGPEVTIEQHSIVDLPVSDGHAVPPPGPLVQTAFAKKAEVPTSETGQTHLPPRRPMRVGPFPLPPNPLLAQITLIAPPIRTAGIGVSAKSATVAFDLPLLRKGAEPLTPARLQALRAILPPGVQALYPAIPTDTLGPSAVNVPLAAESISLVVRKGYGRNEPKWAESLAAHSFSTPPMTMLKGRILDPSQPASQAEAPVLLPIKKPFEPSISPIPGEQSEAETPKRQDETTFGLDEPMVRHGGILDVLGLPVQLAESPEKPHDLPKRHAARADLRSVPTPLVRPTLFQEAQRKVLPHFHTIAATPFAPKSQSRIPSASPTADHAAKPVSPVLPIKKEAPRPMATPVFQPESLRSERAIAPKPVLPAAARAAQAPKPLGPTKQTAPESPHHEGTPRIPAPVTVAPAFPVSAVAREAPKPPPKSNPITIPAVSGASNGPVHAGIVNTVVKVEPAPVNVLPIAPAFKPVAASTTTSSATTVRPPMPLVEKKPEPHEDPALAVQASKGDAVAAAGGRPTAQASTNAAGGKGSKDAEIGLLANEVWSLLKRRLAFEAQRAGQR